MKTKIVSSDLVKTNVSGYYKDPKHNVILNLNDDEYQAYLTAKARSKDHLNLKREVDDLKQLVQMLMQQKGMNV